jgi:hypothetical protein
MMHSLIECGTNDCRSKIERLARIAEPIDLTGAIHAKRGFAGDGRKLVAGVACPEPVERADPGPASARPATEAVPTEAGATEGKDVSGADARSGVALSFHQARSAERKTES